VNLKFSITVKMFLGFLALLILALGVLGALASVWFTRQQSMNLNAFLDAEAKSVSNRLEGIIEGLSLDGAVAVTDVSEALRRDLRTYLEQRANRPMPYKTTLVIWDGQGELLARSNRALDLDGPVPGIALGDQLFEDVLDRGPAYRVLTSGFRIGPDTVGSYRIACLLSSLTPPLLSFIASLSVILVGSLLILTALGYWLIRSTLKPVRSIASAAMHISEQNLGARIPVPPGKDDLSLLANTLNGLLARLETDFAFQERLVGELTHQIKTPLTVLRGRNELGLTTRKDAREFKELVEDNLSDIDALVSLLNSILDLARYDSRIDRIETVPVELRQSLEKLGDELDPLWTAKALSFRLAGPATVIDADPDALRQLFMNLYDNAWKYAPPGSTILTTWTEAAGAVRILVSNQGPPIPDDDLELIFKRFFRSSSLEQTHPGSGLGLSIVRSLVSLHGGRIRAVNPDSGGAAFEIEWPRPEPRSQGLSSQ
jgi:signal transduction histidine kinase